MKTKIILHFTCIIWLMFFCFIADNIWESMPAQIEKDKLFIANEIKPNITLIENFRTTKHRLPTISEFNFLKRGNSQELGNTEYIREEINADDEIKSRVKGMDWNNNYVIAVWRGDWWEYYISAGKQYVTNDYGNSINRLSPVIFIIIGILPYSIWLSIYVYRRKRNRGIQA